MPFGSVVQRRTPTLFAGRLRHKVDLVNVSSVQDSTGGTSLLVNTVYANVWASIEALTGTENLSGDSFQSTISHQIVLRYIGAAPSWMALFNYQLGALAKDSNGNLQQVQTAGISGTVAPTWNKNTNGTTADAAPLVWKNLGPAPVRSGVSSAMQVWFQGRQFQIVTPLNPDERSKMLILLCLEINDSNQQITSQPGGLT